MKNPGCRTLQTITLALALTIMLSSGCTAQDVPVCSAKEALAMLDPIVDKVYRQMNRNRVEYRDGHAITVESIRTRDINVKTGYRECAATLLIKNPKNNKKARVPFTYLIERLDSPANAIHVESQNLAGGIAEVLFRSRLDDPIQTTPSRGFRAVD